MYRRFSVSLFFSFLVPWFFCSLVSFSYAGVLFYSTYLGGSSDDYGYGIAIDGSGNAYITGITHSTNFPTTPGAFDISQNGNSDVFVTKLNADGNALVYSTFLGGSDQDSNWNYLDLNWYGDIAVDNAGNVYISGRTYSTDFPTTPDAIDTSYNGNADGFVCKLNSYGNVLLYSTYLGGTDDDYGGGIAIDNSGNAYITGLTYSSNFPTTTEAFDTGFNGIYDAYVSKLNADATELVYSTYIGGSTYDWGQGIAVDDSDNAYVTGFTYGGFPVTPGAYDTTHNGSYEDVFVTKLNADGSALLYSTYIGGSVMDYAMGIAIDGSGNAYLSGNAHSTDYPTTPGAYDTSFNGGSSDVFITKLNPAGTDLVYSTYLGGNNNDWGYGIAIDSSGNAYITGRTYSSDFPTTSYAFDTSYKSVFVSKVDPTGTTLVYSTFLGNGGGNGIIVDDSENAYVTGWTNSSDFPTTPIAFDTSSNGSYDVFVSKLSLVPTITTTYYNTSGSFDFSSDTGNWLLEKYGNGISAGTLSWISTYQCIAITQTPGQKAKLTQVFSVPSTGWYTTTARALSDISNVNQQQKVYLYLQQLDNSNAIVATGNQVIQPGAGGLNVGGWKQLEISFYATGTVLGVQVVAINNTTSGATGSLYIDDIWVYTGGPTRTNPITLTNPSFDSGTTGWLIQPYSDALSTGVWEGWSGLLLGAQGGGEKAKINQLYTTPINNTFGSVWVFSGATSESNTQKVYLYLYSYDSGYNTIIENGNAILQPGKWVPGQWHQLQFGYTPFTQYNAVQLVGINPIGNPYQAIYFDEVAVNQD